MIEQRNRPAITVRNVSKKHRLFENARDRLKEALHPFSKRYHREFWALQGISFEVPHGQTVGILGRNGSGKSTLLQILASVMQPTSGDVMVSGRVSALLELGAGFNPEFTGRENSVFQAEVVGLGREEIDRKLSEIENFADIGSFFDQPTKVYSSGMFVRVAFAAAINVDPDILIIDEALAVGDAKFQNKCFQKLREFREQGKTILLVTHAMETVTRLCDQAILLEHGRIVKMGSPNDVTNTYFDLLFGNGGQPKLLKATGNYNVVSYLGTYYAVPQALGEIDFHAVDLANLGGVIVGKTIEEVEAHIRKDTTAVPAVTGMMHDQKSGLEVFFGEVFTFDNCSNRRSYNKNESRTGDGRAEIVDYMCVRDDDADVLEVKTWDTLKIYMKILFHQPIQLPVYGMSIKSVDGVKVYGTNTWLDKVSVPPASKSEIVIFCYEIKVSLAGGDVFVSLAVSERMNNQYVLADHRTDLLHIRVQTAKEGMNGLVEMETKSEIFSQTALTKRWTPA
ncbi:MAG: ABC transporter ATP-binding protein [Nitrospira sp.]|nr:ABC transporter ATP-binding protein [Nitrospira sp.]